MTKREFVCRRDGKLPDCLVDVNGSRDVALLITIVLISLDGSYTLQYRHLPTYELERGHNDIMLREALFYQLLSQPFILLRSRMTRTSIMTSMRTSFMASLVFGKL